MLYLSAYKITYTIWNTYLYININIIHVYTLQNKNSVTKLKKNLRTDVPSLTMGLYPNKPTIKSKTS